MRIVLLASGAFSLPTLRWLVQSEHEVALVVTQPARPSGRGRRVRPTTAGTVANELGLKTLEVEDVNSAPVEDEIRSCKARLGLAIAFGQKLGSSLLSMMPAGWINLHASLLPKYRGAAPIHWAIVHGEQRTGCTVFRMVKPMDAGPILVKQETLIPPGETAGALHDRLADTGAEAVAAALVLFNQDTLPEGTPQDESEATYAPKLKKSDGFVHFDQTAVEVVRHICGMTPWPGATARYQAADGRWEKVVINRARLAEDTSAPGVEPGAIDPRHLVAAMDRFVEILELQPSSGRIMKWRDYVNGRHVTAGDRFDSPA